MARNLYILAATLLFFALISFGMTFFGRSQTGLPGNGTLWATSALFLTVGGLVVALCGVLTAMFEQVERRSEEMRYKERRRRPRR